MRVQLGRLPDLVAARNAAGRRVRRAALRRRAASRCPSSLDDRTHPWQSYLAHRRRRRRPRRRGDGAARARGRQQLRHLRQPPPAGLRRHRRLPGLGAAVPHPARAARCTPTSIDDDLDYVADSCARCSPTPRSATGGRRDQPHPPHGRPRPAGGARRAATSSGPSACSRDRCVLGDDNFLASHVSIGGAAEVRGPPVRAELGGATSTATASTSGRATSSRSSSPSTAAGRPVTAVGDDGFFMGLAHLNHDVAVGDEVTVSGSAVVAGHVTIEDGANLGLGVTVHQRRTIGAGAMIGMQAAVTRDLPPYVVSAGVPARAPPPEHLPARPPRRPRRGPRPARGRPAARAPATSPASPTPLRPAIEAWWLAGRRLTHPTLTRRATERSHVR